MKVKQNILNRESKAFYVKPCVKCLCIREHSNLDIYNRKVSKPSEAVSVAIEAIGKHLSEQAVEQFWLMGLSHTGKLNFFCQLEEGTVASANVYLDKVMRYLLLTCSPNAIVFHNHPSGCTKISPQDIHLTRKLAEACRTLNCKLQDHIIIAGNEVISLVDQKLF